MSENEYSHTWCDDKVGWAQEGGGGGGDGAPGAKRLADAPLDRPPYKAARLADPSAAGKFSGPPGGGGGGGGGVEDGGGGDGGGGGGDTGADVDRMRRRAERFAGQDAGGAKCSAR